MNSSGIKRGLAATAISALAITGVPLLSGTAYADSVNDQVGNGNVEIYTQYSGVASNQNDGVNTTIHLLAGGGSDVTTVQFSYTVGAGAAVNIGGPVNRANGVFSTEFAPPASTFGQNVVITATGLNTVGTPVAGAEDTVTAAINQNASAVDIANAPGSALGVFSQPYGQEAQEAGSPQAAITHSTRQGIITGTSSGTGAVTLTDRSSTNPANPRPAVTPAAPVNGVSAYRGTVDFAGYPLDTTAPIVNEAVVGAQQAGGSDDAEVVNLESQAIADVTAVATPATVNQGSTSTAVVSVVDAAGRPLAGAQVIKDVVRDGVWDYDGADNTINTADDEISVYTNALGQASFTGLAGSAAGTAYDFYVNTTGGDDFEPNIDFRRTVTVTSQAQNTTSLTATSADGAAFDTQEYAAGDIAVQVNDQNGAGVPDGRTVSYTWTYTPAPTTAVPNPAAVTTTGTAQTTTPAGGTAGRAVVGAPSNNFVGNGTYVLNAYIESNGTPGQQAGDLGATPLTVKAGDSTLAFTEAPTATSISGTTDTYEASLKLFDGTALAGRAIAFTYGPTGNSVVAAQANQPTGTTRTGNGAATATTNAQGTASVAVSDPATPDQAELNNTLDATTVPVTTNGVANTDADEDAAQLDVDFVDGTPPANSTAVVDADADNADGKPGVASPGTATITSDDNDPATPANPLPVAGTAVTLTVSGNAYFTDGDVVAGGTVGQPATIDNDGKTKTFVTDANGQIDFSTSIGRDTGFDDDGAVTVNVTATSGTVSGTDAETFDSSNPLNGGDVQLVQSDDQDNPTDPTRVGDAVNYDVFTTDQFGNRVGGEFVEIDLDGAGNNDTFGVTSDFDNDTEFRVGANEAGTVTLTATWSAPRNFVYATPTTAGSIAPVDVTDTATEAFDEVDFANSTYTITSSPEGEVAVGTAVTEAVTVVDQNGNPVSGLTVRFIRSGPGQQDGDANVVTETNSSGQAFYSFAGTQAGTAQISAVVEGFDDQPVQTLTDSVVFIDPDGGDGGTDPEVPVRATTTARVSGPNNGATQDRIVVTTTTDQAAKIANGAEVRIYKIVNGRKQQLGGKKRLSDSGRAVFNRRDRNGNGVTRYTANVRFTADTTSANSNIVGLR